MINGRIRTKPNSVPTFIKIEKIRNGERKTRTIKHIQIVFFFYMLKLQNSTFFEYSEVRLETMIFENLDLED